MHNEPKLYFPAPLKVMALDLPMVSWIVCLIKLRFFQFRSVQFSSVQFLLGSVRANELNFLD